MAVTCFDRETREKEELGDQFSEMRQDLLLLWSLGDSPENNRLLSSMLDEMVWGRRFHSQKGENL